MTLSPCDAQFIQQNQICIMITGKMTLGPIAYLTKQNTLFSDKFVISHCDKYHKHKYNASLLTATYKSGFHFWWLPCSY